MTFPTVTKELIDKLLELFPNKCPSEEMSDRQIWIKVGEQKMIQFLTSIYDRQQHKNI